MRNDVAISEASGEKDGDHAVATDFEVVREAEVIETKRGRPKKLNERRIEEICKLIESGETNISACRRMLVSYTRFRAVVNGDVQYQDRVREASKIRDEVWRDHAIEMVRNAMPRNWVAAMTFLERRWPSEFSLKQVVRTESDPNARLVGDKVSEADLKRYAEQMAEFQRENEAKSKSAELPCEERHKAD
jgi:hypothetical protein